MRMRIVYLLATLTAFFIVFFIGVWVWVGDDTPVIDITETDGHLLSDETTTTAEDQKYDQRFALMQAEYAQLEKARRNLDRKLARAKALMWGVHLPANEAQEIVDHTKSGYALLKNKKLLGAFSDPQAISDELARIQYANQKLDRVLEKLQTIQSKRGDG